MPMDQGDGGIHAYYRVAVRVGTVPDAHESNS